MTREQPRGRRPHDGVVKPTEASHGRIGSAALVLALLAGTVGAGPAAGQLAVGAQGSWGSKADFGVGGRLAVGLGAIAGGLEAMGSLDYYFPRDRGVDVSWWEAGANLVYRIDTGGSPVTPYAGLGLGFSYFRLSVEALGEASRARRPPVG